MQQLVSPPVEVISRDDFVPDVGDGKECQGFRRLTAGHRESAGPPLDPGDPLLEDVCGGVHDAGVDVSERLQCEEIGPRVRGS